jgi:hypothetical protein
MRPSLYSTKIYFHSLLFTALRLSPPLTSSYLFFFFILVCEAIGTAATHGLLCQPRVIVKMIVEKLVEWRLAGETEVLGENLPQPHFCPSQNPTWSDPGLNPGCRGGKPATNRLSYGAVFLTRFLKLLGLQERFPKTSAGSWFQSWMVLFTKEYLPISAVCGKPSVIK